MSANMSVPQQYLSQLSCSAQAIPHPNLFGAEFLSLEASLVQNYSRYVHEALYFNHGSINATNLSFCNVTLTHTHPGQQDKIVTQIWLPTSNWNERMQALGGGGWSAGMFPLSYIGMAGAVAEGYAAVTTDGGLGVEASGMDTPEWALLSPGNVDLYSLQNLASVSLNDAAIIGKSITQGFYGRAPKYSYWSGCSQGGRQGYMLAQRYPKAFDGIAASAPAINWGQFGVAGLWPQQVMNEMGEYPDPCELSALTAAAIEACDGKDSLIDGLISDPDSCDFDPYTLVGTAVNCTDTGTSLRISTAAAMVAKAAWIGLKTSNGSFLWSGLTHEAPLTGELSPATTRCQANGTCLGVPISLHLDWVRLFVQKDPTFDFNNMTRSAFERTFHASVQQFSSIIGTNDPNLDEFRDAGGKMLTYHGLVSRRSSLV